jgi:hypothetical protein
MASNTKAPEGKQGTEIAGPQWQGIKATIAARGQGMLFIEALALEIFGYDF